MDESQIAAQLAQNVPVYEAPTPTDTPAVQPADGSTLTPTELDELTLFKMHDFFGEQYKSSNADNKTRLQFIYDNISEQIGSKDYLDVLNRVSELERMIGTAHSENRIYKLYQWVGLDRIRRNTENAMRLING
jgi:hypothetical protein